MLQHLIATYGYLAVALAAFGDSVGLPLPSETVLIIAGGLAATGDLNIVLVWLAAWLAAVAGDGVTFALGHFGGRPFLLKHGKRFGADEKSLARAEKFFAKWGGPGFMVGRFLPVLRAVLPPMLGASGMPYRKFLPWQLATAAIWAAVGAAIGYTGGGVVNRFAGIVWADALKYWPMTLAILGVLALAGVIGVARLLERRAHRVPHAA